jgi:hypothetical protein
MGPKTLGSKYSREPFSNKAMKDEYFVYHSDCSRKDLAVSDDMTKDEKVASLLENARRQVSRKVVRAIQDNTNRSDAIEKLGFGSSRHGYSTDQDSDEDSEDSADSNPVAPPETYRYPQFNPGCPNTQYEMIREFLFTNRQQLALDSLYFDMEEHLMLAYINRLGLDLEPNLWRGFLLSCNTRDTLFKYGHIPFRAFRSLTR